MANPDLENPLLSPPPPTSPRQRRVSTTLYDAMSEIISHSFVFMLFLLAVFIFVAIRHVGDPPQSNIKSAVVSSFNITTTPSQIIIGGWDLRLSLREGVVNYKYQGRAWIFCVGEFLYVAKLTTHPISCDGGEALVRGNFTIDRDGLESLLILKSPVYNNGSGNVERVIFEDDEEALFLDLLVEANVTMKQHGSSFETREFLMVDCNDLKLDRTNQTGFRTLSGGSNSKSCQSLRTFPTRFDALNPRPALRTTRSYPS